MTQPILLDGYAKHQNLNNPERLANARWEYPLQMCRWIHEETARRTAESRKMFRWKFFRGDCHSHTVHSDGIGTVAETAKMVKATGLDFQFVTDHWGLTQTPECNEHKLWVGQEPAHGQYHHLGILGLNFAYNPGDNFFRNVAELKALGATVFIPHPAGWQPNVRYNDEQKRALESLPDPFLMEIVNGANNIVNAWDETDDPQSLMIWDKLLTLGKVVHALGNTDAHAPHAIGIVWNSVFAAKCDQKSILAALEKGRSFVSDGPLVHIQLGQAQMGQRASAADKKKNLQITAVDSRGLSTVRVIANANEVAFWPAKGAMKLEKTARVPKSAKYVRVEVRSLDGRSAYSNPIYL